MTSEALFCFIQLRFSAVPKSGGTVGCKPCGVRILEQLKGMAKLKGLALFRLFLIVGTLYIIGQASLQKHSCDICVSKDFSLGIHIIVLCVLQLRHFGIDLSLDKLNNIYFSHCNYPSGGSKSSSVHLRMICLVRSSGRGTSSSAKYSTFTTAAAE